MIKKPAFRAVATLALSVAAFTANASVFQFDYNGTILATDIPGLAATNPVKITVALDNGGTSLISQTWTAANLQSVAFNFNNGGLLTTFTAPFDGGLFPGDGNFVTDGGGDLTAVMVAWGDFLMSTDYTTNGLAPFSWILDGGNSVYVDSDIGTVDLASVGSMLLPASWSAQAQASVPEPAVLGLFMSGLAGLGIFRKRRALAGISLFGLRNVHEIRSSSDIWPPL